MSYVVSTLKRFVTPPSLLIHMLSSPSSLSNFINLISQLRIQIDILFHSTHFYPKCPPAGALFSVAIGKQEEEKNFILSPVVFALLMDSPVLSSPYSGTSEDDSGIGVEKEIKQDIF